MKPYSSAMMAVAFAFATGATWASPADFSLMEIRTLRGFLVRAQQDCEDLRRACIDKDAMGERGQGNCKRYRSKCGIDQAYCARLIRICMDGRSLDGGRSCSHYRLVCRA
jgi:hypothetical protein